MPTQPESRQDRDADATGKPATRPATYDGGMTHQGIEIERKFRLRAAPSAAVLRAIGAVAKHIEQVYLARPGDDREVAERVRRTATDDGAVTYRHTTKRRIGAFSFDEREEAIDEAAWTEALTRADPARRPVRKTRHVVPHGDQVLEIDVFEAPAGLVVVEVELRDEAETVDLPGMAGRVARGDGRRALPERERRPPRGRDPALGPRAHLIGTDPSGGSSGTPPPRTARSPAGTRR